mmetsp:Transcript_15060/g.21327  ORF Transcript_15060/g.21327 Transcript_15060/m.21327 type:complete len:629 (+) Transcript_15060:71-1957(+)
MGKNRSKKRRREREQQHQQECKKSFLKPTTTGTTAHVTETKQQSNTPQHDHDTSNELPVSPEELLITVETLQAIQNHYCKGGSSTANTETNNSTTTNNNNNNKDNASTSSPTLSTNLWVDVLLRHTKHYKDLRKALYPYLQGYQSQYDPVLYPNRVTYALEHSKWNDALFALQGCLAYEYNVISGTIKRGTIQRWVRFVDDCPYPALKMKLLRGILACSSSSSSRNTTTSSQESQPQQEKNEEHVNKHDPQRVLDELLTQQGKSSSNNNTHNATIEFEKSMNFRIDTDIQEEEKDEEMKILNSTQWCVPTTTIATSDSDFHDTTPTTKSTDDDNNNDATKVKPDNDDDNNNIDDERIQNAEIQIVHHVLPSDRKPPNRYELKIFTTPPNTIRMMEDNDNNSCYSPPCHRYDIDLVPGALFITNVLTKQECYQLRGMAERMGYIPDHPVSSLDPTGIDTCEWLVDDSILSPITKRVMSHLPQVVHGEHVEGINARWRLFRYKSNSIYRPHIDGSWPKSGIDPNTGTYTTDVSAGRQRSRYTFLIYLNDNFQGGGTTFYLPSTTTKSTKEEQQQEEGFDVVSIRPQIGSVLCFPQGNTATLLHEGSRVTGGENKYVVRTDVLYNMTPSTS